MDFSQQKPGRGFKFVPNVGFDYYQTVPPVEWAKLDCSGGDVEGVEDKYLYIYSAAGHEIRINAREFYVLLSQHFMMEER